MTGKAELRARNIRVSCWWSELLGLVFSAKATTRFSYLELNSRVCWTSACSATQITLCMARKTCFCFETSSNQMAQYTSSHTEHLSHTLEPMMHINLQLKDMSVHALTHFMCRSPHLSANSPDTMPIVLSLTPGFNVEFNHPIGRGPGGSHLFILAKVLTICPKREVLGQTSLYPQCCGQKS